MTNFTFGTPLVKNSTMSNKIIFVRKVAPKKLMHKSMMSVRKQYLLDLV